VLPQGARSILGAPNVVDRDRRWGVEEQAAARAARREGSKLRLLSWPKANATERSSCCERFLIVTARYFPRSTESGQQRELARASLRAERFEPRTRVSGCMQLVGISLAANPQKRERNGQKEHRGVSAPAWGGLSLKVCLTHQMVVAPSCC
jgi:hypothetical protein